GVSSTDLLYDTGDGAGDMDTALALTLALRDMDIADGEAVADADGEATPDKSTAVHDIGIVTSLLYLFPLPFAHTIAVTPSNTICASFSSPLCA
ncbi:MAG: hypothetical protein ACK56I_12255, partial [bacterium]